MSQVMSLRIPDQMIERLDRFARRQGNGLTRTKASLMLLEESLRESEFAYVEFRDSSIGRQAYLKGSRLQVWMMIMIARSFKFDVDEITKYYPLPRDVVTCAFAYYEKYRDEIDQAIEDNHIGFEEMKRRLPNVRLVEVNGSVAREVA